MTDTKPPNSEINKNHCLQCNKVTSPDSMLCQACDSKIDPWKEPQGHEINRDPDDLIGNAKPQTNDTPHENNKPLIPKVKADNEKFCSECDNTINIKAEICPKCGVRQTIPTTKLSGPLVESYIKKNWIPIFLLLLFIIGIFSNIPENNKQTVNSSARTICRAAIAMIMQQETSIINSVIRPSGLVAVYYTRDDGKNFEYNCKLSGSRIIWQTYDNGRTGRWRDSEQDSMLTYSISGKTIAIKERWSDGSIISKNFTIN